MNKYSLTNSWTIINHGGKNVASPNQKRSYAELSPFNLFNIIWNYFRICIATYLSVSFFKLHFLIIYESFLYVMKLDPKLNEIESGEPP